MRFVWRLTVALTAVTITGTQTPPKPAVVDYKPTDYHNTYSASHKPGLRINSGDIVRMNTASPPDATGGLPAPIYVNGAANGDVLAVQIMKIHVADKARSTRALELDWFTASFARTSPPPAVPLWFWSLDRNAGVARLDTTCDGCSGPAYQGRMKDLTVPLRPHLGNIGVAPQGDQAPFMPEEGDHGGNFDYPGIEVGTTLYLPVYHPGALLFVADDVHAAQGAGEITCTGLETSADVELTVSVIKGPADRNERVRALRAENATHLMAFGISGDLSQALRIANTNLAEWVQRDRDLRSGELGLVLGPRLELDIANVCGRQVTVVAKIRKDALPKMP